MDYVQLKIGRCPKGRPALVFDLNGKRYTVGNMSMGSIEVKYPQDDIPYFTASFFIDM